MRSPEGNTAGEQGWRSMLRGYKGKGRIHRLSDGYYVRGDYWPIALIEGDDSGKIIGQQTAEFAALLEVHIDNLKGHALAAIVAQQSRGLQITQA
jgi:hypothetical protein